MISMKEWMELVDYKITEGDSYGWQCFGRNSYQLSSWNGIHDAGGYSFNIVFSTKSQKVYSVEVCDYTNDRAYRMINPDYVKKHAKEARSRDVDLNQAWDDVDYVDLEVADDFIQKCLAIKAGEPYDTRVLMPVDFSDEDLLTYMKLAHDRDITFNQLVELALREAMAMHGLDTETQPSPGFVNNSLPANPEMCEEKPTRWTLELQPDPDNPDEVILQFPPDMLAQVGWQEGDVLTWSDAGNGAWELSKKNSDIT